MFDPTTVALATKLVENCRSGKEMEGLDALYAPDAVSVEASAMPGAEGRETNGVAAIKAKHDWWNNTFEIHDAGVEGPFFHGPDRFGAIFEVDATNRETGERSQMRELAIYSVSDGKIVREEFYYTGGE